MFELAFLTTLFVPIAIVLLVLILLALLWPMATRILVVVVALGAIWTVYDMNRSMTPTSTSYTTPAPAID